MSGSEDMRGPSDAVQNALRVESGNVLSLVRNETVAYQAARMAVETFRDEFESEFEAGDVAGSFRVRFRGTDRWVQFQPANVRILSGARRG